MDIQIDRRANRVIVHCLGEMDGRQSLAWTEPIERLLDGVQPVVLDLAAVPRLSDAGVESLRRLFESAAERQAAVAPQAPPMLRLANVGTSVQEVLDASGFSEGLAGWPANQTKSGQGYRALLPRVREMFPAPVSDPLHDAYFVQSVARALDHVDQFKNGHPYLGEQLPLNYDAARTASLPVSISSLETVIAEVADRLQGQVNWGHCHTQAQVIPPVTIGAILGQMFGAIYNPNLLWDAYSHRVAEAEIELAAMCAGMVGYDPQKAAGISTFGGTGTEMYGVKIGVEKAQPGAFRKGVRGNLKIVASDASHYCKLNVAAWLGLGIEQVVSIPTDNDNSMNLAALEGTLHVVLEHGEQLACIIATMGTTDAFGLDNVAAVVRLRDKLVADYRLPYRPHVHADAVIGWPWAVFNDYDFAGNALGFGPRTLRSLWDARATISGLHLADSIGIDFHKTGYGPIISSMFLCKDHADLSLISRDPAQMPYLFQFGNYHPGIYTLETSRSGGAVLAALANLKLLGKEGYRVILGHIVTMAEVLRAKLERAAFARVVNDANHGMVTLFRVYPDGVDANLAYHEESTQPRKAAQLEANNEYNRKVFEALRRQVERGDGVNLGLTAQYRLSPTGIPVVALKSFVMSPFVDEGAMDYLVTCLQKARHEVETADSSASCMA